MVYRECGLMGIDVAQPILRSLLQAADWMDEIVASVVIASRDRRDDVLRAIGSCFAQRNVALEVLVYDDASGDGTVDAVRLEWPDCRVFESTTRTGYIVNRNRAFHDAMGVYVFSLDDDSYFSSPDTVADTIKWFEEDSRVGAVAIPYIEPLNRRSLSSLTTPFPGPAGREVRSYVGCAHAVRKATALELDGYREFFVHQNEEREFCLRLRAAGWRIVYGDGAPVVHLVSPAREHDRITFYACRNQILSEALNAPFPDMLPRVIRTSLGLIRYRFALHDLPLRIRGIGAGLMDSIRFRHLRRPVGRNFYRQHRRLPAHGPLHWETEVPPPCQDTAGAA